MNFCGPSSKTFVLGLLPKRSLAGLVFLSFQNYSSDLSCSSVLGFDELEGSLRLTLLLCSRSSLHLLSGLDTFDFASVVP